MVELTPRLSLAAKRCTGAVRVIDVGCDHGHLSIHLIANIGAQQVIATDIGEGPLMSARKNIEKYNLQEKIKLSQGNGLAGFSPESCDTIVICGMGGDLICRILDAAPWCMKGNHRLVLQPMTRLSTLREYLHRHDCGIVFEGLCLENRRLYCVMEARGGEIDAGQEHGYIFSKKMIGDPLFQRFLLMNIKKYDKIVLAKLQAGQDCGGEKAVVEMLNKYRKEV